LSNGSAENRQVRKMSDDEIADAILDAKKKLFELRLQQATAAWKKPTNSNTPATVLANY